MVGVTMSKISALALQKLVSSPAAPRYSARLQALTAPGQINYVGACAATSAREAYYRGHHAARLILRTGGIALVPKVSVEVWTSRKFGRVVEVRR
jgi:hypothetical protein